MLQGTRYGLTTHQVVISPQELLEDFTSGGFNLDLMDDDGPAFTSDPVFSSPQVSSPNSSHHSFDDALTPDSMDIAAWLWICVIKELIFLCIFEDVNCCSFSWSGVMCTYEASYCFSSVLFVISNLLQQEILILYWKFKFVMSPYKDIFCSHVIFFMNGLLVSILRFFFTVSKCINSQRWLFNGLLRIHRNAYFNMNWIQSVWYVFFIRY